MLSFLADGEGLTDAVRGEQLARALLATAADQLAAHPDVAPATFCFDPCMCSALAARGNVPVNEIEHRLARGNLDQIFQDAVEYCASSPHPTETTRFLASRVSPQPGDLVVDIGCSTGRHFLELSSLGARLVGIDIDQMALHVAQQAWSEIDADDAPVFCAADALELPLQPGSCAIAISCVVLAALPMRQALQGIHEILKPGGKLVLTLEGVGFWQEVWDATGFDLRGRIGLLRWRIGRALLEAGVEWQTHPALRRLAGYPQYRPELVRKLLRETGFACEEIVPLRKYRDQLRLFGVVATKV